MRHHLLLFFFSFVFGNMSFAQSILQGRVISAETGKPVPYANIGIVKKNFGTLSNDDGTFMMRVPESNINDTLQFSALGYGKINIPISHLKERRENTISLNEQPVQLEVVTVTQKKEKNQTFELGNTRVSGGVLETDTAFAGRSIALLIDNRQSDVYKDLSFPIYLQQARLRIFKNNLNTLKFRVRINGVDPETGEPGEDRLRESVVVESGMRKGWLEFDLSKIDIVVSQPFFCNL